VNTYGSLVRALLGLSDLNHLNPVDIDLNKEGTRETVFLSYVTLCAQDKDCPFRKEDLL
jgi:hypothetical protein